MTKHKSNKNKKYANDQEQTGLSTLTSNAGQIGTVVAAALVGELVEAMIERLLQRVNKNHDHDHDSDVKVNDPPLLSQIASGVQQRLQALPQPVQHTLSNAAGTVKAIAQDLPGVNQVVETAVDTVQPDESDKGKKKKKKHKHKDKS